MNHPSTPVIRKPAQGRTVAVGIDELLAVAPSYEAVKFVGTLPAK